MINGAKKGQKSIKKKCETCGKEMHKVLMLKYCGRYFCGENCKNVWKDES